MPKVIVKTISRPETVKKLVLLTVFIILYYFVIHSGLTLIKQTGIKYAVTQTAAPKKQSISFASYSWLIIDALKTRNFPGSEINIGQELPPGSNYKQFQTSYLSDGLRISGLLTIPQTQRPKNGYPVIIFNHGYIPPGQYLTDHRYDQQIRDLAENGYIVFKPDFRGNGYSEGVPSQSYIAPDYIIDDMNAIASIKKFKEADPDRIGIMAHSMGGNITLYDLVISHDIRAASIWSGVVGSYGELFKWGQQKISEQSPGNATQTEAIIGKITSILGTPDSNPFLWNFVDPSAHIRDITAPVQIQAGLADQFVPWQFSQSFSRRLMENHKTQEFYSYPDGNHDLSGMDFQPAITRTLTFFDKYLKGVRVKR